MASRGKAFVVAALLVSVLGTSYVLAQTQPVATTQPAATTTKAAPSVLRIVPADAWGVFGINDFQKFDQEVMRLSGQLSLPMFIHPSGLIQMSLGITEGFDPRGGMAMIFLDKMKYGQARQWQTFSNLPAPMVLAVAATDAQVLIKAMGGKPGEEGAKGLMTVMLGQDTVSAAAKGGYVLLSPDPAMLRDVAGIGGPATRPAAAAMSEALTKQIDGANMFLLVNVKPIATALDPMVRGLLAMLTATAQAAQAQGGAGAPATPNMGMLAGQYFDILTKQVDKLVVLGNLDATGLMLSGVVTFQPDTLLNKVFTSLKPADKPLAGSLPDGQFMLAAGSVNTGDDFAKELADLFSKPMIDAMKSAGDPALAAAAEQQTKMMNMRIELSRMQQSGRLAVYIQPDGQDGLLAAVAAARFTDAGKAYDLIKQVAKAQMDAVIAQQPKAKDFLSAITYTPEAETIDSAKVHVLLLDMTKIGGLLPDMSEGDVNQAIKVVRTLFGTDGLTVRIAVSDKDIVAALGGGTPLVKKALDVVKSGAAPLVKQASIAKVEERLPKNRVSTAYVSAENVLTAVNKAAKALDEDPLPIQPGETSAPLVGMMLADPAGLHVGLYLPTELMVSARGMVNQVMQQERRRGMEGDQAGEDAGEVEEAAPAPDETEEEPQPEF